MSQFLLGGQYVTPATFLGSSAVLATGEMAAIMDYNFKAGVPGTLAKRVTRQIAVRTAAGPLRAKIAQQGYLIGNY
jgi:hypothetical protein